MPATDTDIFLRDHRFVKTLSESLRSDCRVQRGQRLLLAVSGGRDSMALLHAMHGLAGQPHWALDLHIGHVNHHLREDAGNDAAHAAAAAERLGLRCHLEDAHPAEASGNLEANARRMRYAALAHVARQIDADAVVTAHHADDQLETLLMRLIRGAGPTGLAGMTPIGDASGLTVLRPMLGLDAGAIDDYCAAAGVHWREDVTNTDAARWRARLRRDVLPVLKALRADAATKAGESATMLAEAGEALEVVTDRTVKRLCEPTGTGWTMPRADLRDLPKFLRGGVIRRALVESGLSADRLPRRLCEQIAEAAADDVGGCRTFDLPGGARLRVESERIRFEIA